LLALTMDVRRLMKFLVVSALLSGSLAASPKASAIAETNAPICTISTSHQFVAYAHDRLLSSALCVYAEGVKRQWLRRMNLADQWRDPIVLVVDNREPSQTEAPPISWETFQTDRHLKYQIYLCASPLDEAALLSAIVDRLCAEWANRAQATVHGQEYIVPVMPLWLVQGLAASIHGRTDALLSAVRRSVAAGRPVRASELLDARVLPSNPAERTLYQANAWVFTESLLTLPGGAEKLQRFLADLGSQKSASRAFWSVYRRDFPRDLTMEKWWSLQRVNRASVARAENLTAEDTEKRLDAILMTKLGATNGRRGMPDTDTPLDQLWRYSDASWLKDLLKLKSDQLGLLRGQAHPFFEPAIDRYIEAINWLLQQNTVRFRRSVAKAAAARAVAERQTQATSAYLDKAERTYTPEELSKPLTGYLNTLNRFQDLDQQRRNPISDHLDQFDR
jgi:hypothetical protein